ncbi:protein of unknown function [Kyrpidia spormannii]|uniref:Uncharacterized protein n=1 Tax=Kyrpidia spormannii TaxID=2055160 RepID=A0ACA8Z593_9BACL|nr:protein of unknown function [Kyrpidia spormannii]
MMFSGGSKNFGAERYIAEETPKRRPPDKRRPGIGGSVADVVAILVRVMVEVEGGAHGSFYGTGDRVAVGGDENFLGGAAAAVIIIHAFLNHAFDTGHRPSLPSGLGLAYGPPPMPRNCAKRREPAGNGAPDRSDVYTEVSVDER